MKRANRLYLPWIALVLVACPIGCGPVIGWFVNAFAPPKKIKAVYKPPKGRRIMVFVDDLLNPVSYEPIKSDLTEQLNSQLMEHKVAAQTVPYEDLLDLIAATPEFNTLSIGEVGQRLGADIVLYVQIDWFSLREAEGSPLWQGRLETTVWMVDVQMAMLRKSECRIWPDDRSTGYHVNPIEMPAEANSSEGYGRALAKVMAGRMADRIAKLFYDYQISAHEAIEREQAQQQAENE